jgi:hypothetical protein
MSAVYRFLRGVDPVTGEADPDRRLRLLNELDDAAKICIEPTAWRDFLLRVRHAGFLNESLIASKNAIVNAFTFYTRGRKLGVAKPRLDSVIARWIFGSLLTARYSGSSETAFEQDLGRLAHIADNDGDAYAAELDKALAEILTGDYWSLTLVSSLATQKSRAPAALAFRAAQVVLGARALFSDELLRNLLDPPSDAGRAAREAHHLFARGWLRAHGVQDLRQTNQVANLADVGWHENSTIGSQGPATYVARLRDHLKIDDDRWGRMCAEHALPPSWEQMDYQEFLGERRKRMADVIHVAFRQLGGEADAAPLTPPWFLPGAEGVWKRIAETERVLRVMVREVYAHRFGDGAAAKIETGLQEFEREALKRATRTRPQGSDPLSVVDYLFLGQLPRLLFADAVWQDVKSKLTHVSDLKRRLQSAMDQITPVRNEIAHVREVSQERLLRATVACNDVIEMLAVRVRS